MNRTLAQALDTRCCGPEGCGRYLTPSEAERKGADRLKAGRYCIGDACMAWQWASDADAATTRIITVRNAEVDDLLNALGDRSANNRRYNGVSMVAVSQEEAEAIRVAYADLLSSLPARLEAWVPEPPPEHRTAPTAWALECKVVTEDDRLIARFVRTKTDTERSGHCGLAVAAGWMPMRYPAED